MLPPLISLDSRFPSESVRGELFTTHAIQESMNENDRPVHRARKRMEGFFTPNQLLGRTLSIGCVAIEVTQRCNLDCTLCYLSENAELVSDIPIEEVFNRLDRVREEFGKETNVQITGGEPTLRKHRELVKIVRYARDIELFPSLFTNGIAASRKLLTQLAEAGLYDVAFHVDTTQRRKNFSSEEDLNAVRLECLERVRDLGLTVIFNTTVHNSNIDEIPVLVKFFAEHADQIGLASFQLQADTGRGIMGSRNAAISLTRVRDSIESGTQTKLPWEVVRIGHPACHSYVPTLVINDSVYPIIDDVELFSSFVNDFAGSHQDRRYNKSRIIVGYLIATLRQPVWLLQGARYIVQRLWQARSDLIAARGRVQRLSFFIQNFMDANDLDYERIEACSFMVMTSDGPVSMCEHNAHRDNYIMKSIAFHVLDGTPKLYHPLVKSNLYYAERSELKEDLSCCHELRRASRLHHV